MQRRTFTRLAAGAAAASLLPRTSAGAGAGAGAGAAGSAAAAPLRVNGERLNGWLTALSEFGKNPQGGVTRLAYSAPDVAGRAYITQLMRDAGLAVRVDAAGNIYGNRAGTDANAAPIIFGSHIDSVPEGGNYDGDVGTLAAIEVARSFAEQKITTKHPLEIVCWQNEEGGTVGSDLATNTLTDAQLDAIARSGLSLRDGITAIGGDVSRLATARRAKGSVHGYLELHIEQGGKLDKAGLPIGIVEGIVGIRQWDVVFEGFSNHAGTTPMAERKDAMLTAARFIEMVHRIVRSRPGAQVGNVGRIQAFPGAVNVIPGRVNCSLEIRDLAESTLDWMIADIRREAAAIATESGVSITLTPSMRHEPALCDPRVKGIIGDSAKEFAFATMSLPSGAGHDAQNLARIAPMGMIFIPSVGGISHSPKEFSRPADIVNGANVLAAAVRRMDTATFS
jgi:N-carbamoyl-L-amino-acid hydrolase